MTARRAPARQHVRADRPAEARARRDGRHRPPEGRRRPWLGLNSAEEDGRLKVIRVSGDGPAERRGIEPGDIILALSGKKVENLPDFYRRLWSAGAPGVEVTLKVLKGTEVRRRQGALDRPLREHPQETDDLMDLHLPTDAPALCEGPVVALSRGPAREANPLRHPRAPALRLRPLLVRVPRLGARARRASPRSSSASRAAQGLIALEALRARDRPARSASRSRWSASIRGRACRRRCDYRDLPAHLGGGLLRDGREEAARALRERSSCWATWGHGAAVAATGIKHPVGFVAFDLDYYSSTVAALKIFDGPHETHLPRVHCYFDDLAGQQPLVHEPLRGRASRDRGVQRVAPRPQGLPRSSSCTTRARTGRTGSSACTRSTISRTRTTRSSSSRTSRSTPSGRCRRPDVRRAAWAGTTARRRSSRASASSPPFADLHRAVLDLRDLAEGIERRRW